MSYVNINLSLSEDDARDLAASAHGSCHLAPSLAVDIADIIRTQIAEQVKPKIEVFGPGDSIRFRDPIDGPIGVLITLGHGGYFNHGTSQWWTSIGSGQFTSERYVRVVE